MSYWTAPQFFRGEIEAGACRCAYCSGRCDDSAPASKFVLASFTARDSLSGGTHVCLGCRLAMDERADVTLIDGESRTSQKTRLYSWFVPRPESRNFLAQGFRQVACCRLAIDHDSDSTNYGSWPWT